MIISDFIICDDIRFEENKKLSIMGVIEDVMEIAVPPKEKGKWPKLVTFGLLIRCIVDESEFEKNPVACEVIVHMGDEKITIGRAKMGKSSTDEKSSNRIAIATVLRNFPAKSPGLLNAGVKIYDADDNLIAEEFAKAPIRLVEKVLATNIKQ